MNLVFDQTSDKQLKRAMYDSFEPIKNSLQEERSPLAENMAELTFADSEKSAPLQAADLIAHQAHVYAKAAQGKDDHPVGPVYFRLLARFRSMEDFHFFNARRFSAASTSLRRHRP